MVGFSTVDSISDTLVCNHLETLTVLVSASHVHIEFSTRFRDEGDGFMASYQGVTNDVIGKHKRISILGLTRRGRRGWGVNANPGGFSCI